MTKIPPPLEVSWAFKSVASARSWVNELPDGRVQYRIEHEVLRGVRPAMIVWYLNHMTDLIDVGGQTVQLYRLWHPRDHIAMTYLQPARDGRNFGAGARLRIQEAFQADLRFRIDVEAQVDFLDETGFAHRETFAGLPAAQMQYTFTNTEAGTRYENSLTVGVPGGSWFARLLNRLVVPRVFPREKGQAWIRHNIEEVGAFEAFLPELYAARAEAPVRERDARLGQASREG